MNELIDKLKNDTFSGILDLAGKTFWPMVIASIVQMVLSFLLLASVFSAIFGISYMEFSELQSLQNDPVAIQERGQAMVESMLMNFGVTAFLLMIFSVVVVLFISAWIYNVAFVAIEDALAGKRLSVMDVLKRSFDNRVVKLFVASLVLTLVVLVGYILVIILIGILSSIGALGRLLAFGVLVVFFIYLFRFIIVYPLVAYSNLAPIDAIRQSYAAISMRKAAKYFLISILVGIALIIGLLVMAFIVSLFARVPVLGGLISFGVNVLFSGLILALTCAFMVALYLKYGNGAFGEDQNNIEDHLLYQN